MPHNRSLLRDVHPPNLPWAAGSSSNDDQSAKAIAFHSRDLEMCPTLLDPILDATSSDGIPVHPTIVPQYAVLGEVVGVGGRQAAKASDTAGATERPVVLYNTNTPSTTLICGVQGVGKSHTLNAILEAALIKHDGCGQLVEPVTPLILHYDTVSDFKCLPCESVHLGTISDSSGGASPKVTVLVSPTNFKPMEQVYKGISNVDGLLKELRSVAIMTTYLPQVTVHPLLLSERDLTVKRVHNLMCVDEYTVKPLYINVIEQELRAINSRSERFSFSAFERAMANNQLNPQQSAMFDLRMSLIKSCIKEQVVSNKTFPPDLRQRASRTPPLSELFGIKGGVVIIDLSDPYIDRASACSLFDIVVGMFCAVGDKSRDAGGAGKIVVLDEAHKFLAQKNEGSIPLIETLTTLIAQQRHVGLRLLISTQDPTGVPVRILELTSTFILHAFNSPSWFNHLRAHIKFNGKGTGDEREGELRVFDVILSLPLGIAVVVSPRGLGISETSGVHANTVSREDGVRDFSSVQRMGGDYWIVSIRERITKDGGKSVFACAK
ncbi:hypothetical protein HK101_002870 [Irineochytrium annulatum]|nr:hypothetical protein HK101_002870 [Irineochytrium annulatum]